MGDRRAALRGPPVLLAIRPALQLPELALEHIVRLLANGGEELLRNTCRKGRLLANVAVTAAKVRHAGKSLCRI